MSSRESLRGTDRGQVQSRTVGTTTAMHGTGDRARDAATRLCEGFVEHDRRNRSACLDAFAAVDREQFPHLTDEQARQAASGYVTALWEKDEVERPYVEGDRVVDAEGLAAADWSGVREALERRADVVGMDRAYAAKTTTAWKRHKVGGDYWTPTMAAQRLEIDAALGEECYPTKPRFGADGFGHLATRYLTGVELHDMRSEAHWAEAVEVMTRYFADLFDRQGWDE